MSSVAAWNTSGKCSPSRCDLIAPLSALSPKLSLSLPSFFNQVKPSPYSFRKSSKMKCPLALPVWTPHFRETLEGSFSAVSKPIFTTKYSFCRIFQDLQDSHSFAPPQIQIFNKNSSNFLTFFTEISANFARF